MIETVLWDVDGTLLNFTEAERAAITTCFSLFGLGACTEDMVRRYSAINTAWWERLERGEATKREILRGRFREFFAGEGVICADLDAFNAEYQQRLGDTICYNDDSLALVTSLRGRVRQCAVTNGTLAAQTKKLARSGLGELFDAVFISDEIGYEKPDVRFFDAVFASLGPCDRRRVMIVGDSLTGDMRGGNNAGILTCWYNPEGKPNDRVAAVTYEIRDLWEIPALLG